MEQAVLHRIHSSHTHAKITVTGQVPLAPLLRAIANQQVPTYAITYRPDGWAAIVPRTTGVRVAAALQSARPHLGFTHLTLDSDIAEVAITGSGLRSDPAIRPIFCEALTRIGVTLDFMSATGNRLAVLCPDRQAAPAIRALREALEITVAGVLLTDDSSAYATVQADSKSG
ncbi:hypothetical protein [Crossiella sp. CA198]|uniref:hypothetical protein n=1 Tax=Crossiella sp. CA198 TaxID=3455607 RepID=UPI003F8D2B3B